MVAAIAPIHKGLAGAHTPEAERLTPEPRRATEHHEGGTPPHEASRNPSNLYTDKRTTSHAWQGRWRRSIRADSPGPSSRMSDRAKRNLSKASQRCPRPSLGGMIPDSAGNVSSKWYRLALLGHLLLISRHPTQDIKPTPTPTITGKGNGILAETFSTRGFLVSTPQSESCSYPRHDSQSRRLPLTTPIRARRRYGGTKAY